MLARLIYNLWYLFKPPWDSGITPPEIVHVVEGSAALPAGRALDIGCGSGTNCRYLARHGWRVVGVDYALLAILKARWQSRHLHPKPLYAVGDVSQLGRVRMATANAPYDFAFDIGCLHSLSAAQRISYAHSLAMLLRAGALYMLYGFQERNTSLGRVGISATEVNELFGRWFEVLKATLGVDPSGGASAWYALSRKDSQGQIASLGC